MYHDSGQFMIETDISGETSNLVHLKYTSNVAQLLKLVFFDLTMN